MNATTFLEIIFLSEDFTFNGRGEIEDPLNEALRKASLGEVTGGGSGMGKVNIDVEVTDPGLGLDVILQVLRGLCVAPSTYINQYEPVKTVRWVYD